MLPSTEDALHQSVVTHNRDDSHSDRDNWVVLCLANWLKWLGDTESAEDGGIQDQEWQSDADEADQEPQGSWQQSWWRLGSIFKNISQWSPNCQNREETRGDQNF